MKCWVSNTVKEVACKLQRTKSNLNPKKYVVPPKHICNKQLSIAMMTMLNVYRSYNNSSIFRYFNVTQVFSPVGHVFVFLCTRVLFATAQATIGWFLSTSPWLTLVCWKCDPIPIPDGEPGEGTGEVLGEGWRFPVISIMSWPMSFSSSSGKGRSNMSSEGSNRDVKDVSTSPKNLNFGY